MARKTPKTGQLIHCGGYKAFVPDPLPPSLEWTQSLLRALSDADRLVGRLAGEGRTLPNPHLLMRPFLQREAVLSSRIEGTQATLGELLAVEAGATVERSPDDLREVGNYVVAMEHGMARLGKLPLSLRLVRELHAKLMQGVRGQASAPGEFRRTQNWIGPAGCTLANATFVPPPPNELSNCLGEWEKFLHDVSLPPLVQAARMHYQYEANNPFLDGNGRVGRLLITLFLVERRILPTPLLYLSAFFEATRPEYYERLNSIREKAAWGPWIEYFLAGVARMSEDALGRAERINTLLAGWRQRAVGTSRTPTQLVDLLAENPYWSAKRVAERLGVAFTTAQRAIDQLIRAKILVSASQGKRDRVYVAKAIMSILDEPAHLEPSER